MKTCSKCKIPKELSEFGKDKSKKDGHQYSCKTCYKKFYRSNINKEKERKLKFKYGITLSEFNEILKFQENKCIICKNLFNTNKICVDHCHKTGKVRALLCNNCNSGLGFFNDNIDFLKEAILYLGNYNE